MGMELAQEKDENSFMLIFEAGFWEFLRSKKGFMEILVLIIQKGLILWRVI